MACSYVNCDFPQLLSDVNCKVRITYHLLVLIFVENVAVFFFKSARPLQTIRLFLVRSFFKSLGECK